MPSVRGTERIVVAALLMSSSALSGALAGFVLGIAGDLAGAPFHPSLWAIAAAVAVMVGLDLVVAPPSVRRQVPQLWGRIFSPRSTAVLYGARLGVGPLTILRTWWWWLAVVAGAAAGVWVSVATGALFGATRIAVMLAAGTKAGALRRNERLAAAVGVLTAAALIAVAVLAAPAEPRRSDAEPERSVDSSAGASNSAPRSDTAPSTTTVTSAPPVVADPALEERVPDDVGTGFVRITDDPSKSLGPIDLATAARIERDEQAERSLLETRHFVAGHTRAWRRPDGRFAYVAAYRFATAGDAEAYRGDGFLTLESRGARAYDLSVPAGARGFSQASSSDGTGEVAHGVAFVRGDVFLLVIETSTSSAATAADAARLATIVDARQAPPSG